MTTTANGDPTGASKSAFYDEVNRFVGWYLAENPVMATEMGLHAYDNRLADTSPEGLARVRLGLEQFLERLPRYRPAGDVDWEIDYRLMAAMAGGRLRALDRRDLAHRSPDFYAAEALFGPYSLLMKEFAPLDERLRNLAGRLAEVPRVLAEAERNLDVCPPSWIDGAVESVEGGLALLQHLIPALAQSIRADDMILATRIEATNTKAIAAVERYRQFLVETLRPRAGGTFAIGEDAWNAMVREEHMLDLDATAIEAIGQDLIRETQAALAEEAAAIVAREGGPPRTWQELLNEVRADHPTPDGLVPA
jgi:uncharacterized protein (DUF885 family)